MSGTPEPRYGAQRVRRSLLHFVMGKALGAVLGLSWLFALVRALPETDYGAYFTCYAYLELMILVSAWGSVQLLERFVPELHEQRRDGAVVALAAAVLRLRALLLAGTVALALALQAPLLRLLALPGHAEAFWLINGVLLAEGLCRTIDSFHDGLLRQRQSQLSVLFRNGLKVLALLVLLAQGVALDLVHWLRIELALMGLALAWSAGLYLASRRALLRKAQAAATPLEWARYWRYGLYIFGCQWIWMLTSMDALKILVNQRFGLETAALFGFCLALVLVVQRYLPTYLLVGLVRPLFIVARQREDQAQRLRELAALFFKLNLAPLLPLLMLSLLHEDALLALASGGRFEGGEQVLSLLLGLLIVQALKNCQALVLAALEDGRGALLASAVSAAVFGLAALLLLPRLGLQGLLLALLLAEGVSLAVQRRRVAGQGVQLQLPWGAVAGLLLANGLALALVQALVRLQGLGQGATLALAALACALATLGLIGLSAGRFFDAAERQRLLGLLPAGLARRLGQG